MSTTLKPIRFQNLNIGVPFVDRAARAELATEMADFKVDEATVVTPDGSFKVSGHTDSGRPKRGR